MKKIIISIAGIGLASALAVGGTIAFYKDTETSTGNVMTAGTIDLTIDSYGAVYNGNDINSAGWSLTDLTNEKFFSFNDIKPADHGRRSISLHVNDNDAWACLLVTNREDDENVRIDPELDAGDMTEDDGELSQNIEVFAWEDNDNNGTYNPVTDVALVAEDGVMMSALGEIVIADSTSGSPLTNTDTRQINIAWCAGDQTVDTTTGVITCDGGGMTDVAQTDEFTADIVAYAVQVRNNEDFKCSEVELVDQPTTSDITLGDLPESD